MILAKIIEWFNMKTGFRFWYEIELSYLLKREADDGVLPFITRMRRVGLANKRTILNDRKVKKVFGDWISKMPKEHRRNGIFQVTVIAYLGWFRESR